MYYTKVWHVWYSGCMDNTPTEPDFNNEHYKMFESELNAFLYAHDVVRKINEESHKEGFFSVEYGVMEVPIIENSSCNAKGVLFELVKSVGELKFKIEEIENKLKDLGCEKFEIYAPSISQDRIDELLKPYRDIDEEIKELKKEFRDDLLSCRGMDYKEMICYVLDLENKYDVSK